MAAILRYYTSILRLLRKVEFGTLMVKNANFYLDSTPYLALIRTTGQIISSSEIPPCWKVFL